MFEIEISNSHIEKPKRKTTKSNDHDSDIHTYKPSDTASIFRRILETIVDIVDTCEINATEKGINIQVIDTLNACIIDTFLSKDFFHKYRCDRSLSLGIRIKDLLKILKSIAFENTYVFKMFADDNCEFLNLDYDCEGYNLKFDLTLFVFKMEKYELPHLEYDVEVEMKTNEFCLVSKMLGKLDESIEISSKDKSLIFSQKSDRARADLTIKEKEGVIINILKNMKKEISMKYVLCATKAAGLCEDMKICMGTSTPVFLEFELMEWGFMKFFLAPKSQDEENKD